ncbi:unnamed protein product [Prunus armeniaca]
MKLIGTPEELQKTADYFKCEFEMTDLGKTKYCLGLHIEHSANGILVHQSTYTEKVLKQFGMDKAHPLRIPMVVRSLDTKKDPYRPKGDDEMIQPCSNKPTLDRHQTYSTISSWDYIHGLILFQCIDQCPSIVGYADVGYLSDPHQRRSQIGYVFTCGGTAISWRSKKQTLVATSSNHSEILALHGASHECVWLR